MSTLRVFTAVELPRATRQAVVDLAERLLAVPQGGAGRFWRRGLSPVPPENLHVTVRFLGDVDEERLPEVLGALRTGVAAVPPGPAEVSGVGAFPTPARPRVVWCGVTDTAGTLTRLEGAARDALLPLGFPPEDRPYHPHVTLARVRDGRVGRDLAGRLSELIDGAPPRCGAVPVDHLTVFHSTASRGDRSRGPRYECLDRIELTEGP